MNQNLTPFAARIGRKSLADALKVMAKIIEKRNPIPILSCLMLEPGQACVTVRGTDLDINASIQLPADCQPGPAVCVSAATLKDATGKAKGEFITLSDIGGNRVSFRDGETGAAMSLPSLPADDFPLPQGNLAKARDMVSVPAVQMLTDLKRLSIAVSTDETRYYLNGIFWHLVDGELRLAATDGHRMAHIARPAPAGLPETFPDAILPRKTCDVLAFIMAKPGDRQTRFGFTASTAAFRFGNIEVLTKLVDGTFPDYRRIIPSCFTRRLTVSAETLADAVKAVTAHVSGKTSMVQLSLDPEAGWLTVSARCPDNGPAAMEVTGADIEALGPIAYSGSVSDDGTGKFSLGCNAAYLAQLLAPFGDDPVTISIQDASGPMRITAAGQPEYLQVLMPMRADGEAVTPASIAKMNQSPLEAFEADAPAHVQAIADIEASEGLTPSGKRRAVRSHARDLAHLIRGAIALLASTVTPAPVPMSRFAEATVGGKMKTVPLMDGRRRAARLFVLLKLARMRGENDCPAFFRLNAIYGHTQARSSYLEWERGLSGTMPETHRLENTSPAETETALYARHGKLPDPARPAISGDDAESQPVEAPAPAPMPGPAEAAPMPEPEPVAANDDGNRQDSPPVTPEQAARTHWDSLPMFKTLQDFKAAAGVGSRWILSNHAPGIGWNGERLVTVATVKARDLGFLRGEATPEQLADANRAKGHSGRTWIGFPKQGQWESTPEGLVILYRDGSPCMKVVPAPALADLAQPVAAEGQPQEAAPDNDALQELVATLVARIERLETSLQTRDAIDGGMDVEGPESLPAPGSAENIGNSVAMVPLSDLEEARERAVRAELRADGLQHDLADMEERAVKAEGLVSPLRTRIGRMGLVLAGRKAQLAAVGRDLLFARSKAAQLQRELQPQPGSGDIILPINIRKAG